MVIMTLEAKQVGNIVTGKHDNVRWQDLIMDKKLNLYERRIMQKVLDQYESEKSQISQDTKKALNAFIRSDFMGKNEEKVRKWFDGKSFSLEQIKTKIGAESTEWTEFIAKLMQWQKQNIWVMKSIAKDHPESLREGADLEKESLTDGILDQLTLRAMFPEEAPPATSSNSLLINDNMPDQVTSNSGDDMVSPASPVILPSENSPSSHSILPVATTIIEWSNQDISREDSQKTEINTLIGTLETATLWLHTDNQLDPQEKISVAKIALKALKENPTYAQLAFSGGIEQKTPETQKVAELEWLLRRAENKDELCRLFVHKIQWKGEIEYWDPDWLAINGDNTSITINVNWWGDANIIGSWDYCAWFTMQETYDILLANKDFFQKWSRIAAKPHETQEDTTEISSLQKYLKEWSQEREWASWRRKLIDANGGDYEKTREVGNWDFPDQYAHVDFLEGMMKDFDDGVDYYDNQKNLAKTGVEKTWKRLEWVKKNLEMLKTATQSETDSTKKIELQTLYDETSVKYREDQKRYVVISANLWNAHEEQDEFLNVEMSVKQATEYVADCKTADEALSYLRDIHRKIFENSGQSSKAKEAYKAITESVWKSVFEKIQNDTTLTQESKNEKMVALARLVSQRETDIDNDVQDSALAIDVLEKVLSMPDAAIGYMQKQGKPSPLAREVEAKKKTVLPALQRIENDAKKTGANVSSIMTPEQKKIIESTPKTLVDISAQYSLVCFLEIAVKNIEIAKRRSGIPPSDEWYLTLNQSEIQDTLNKSIVPYIEEGTKWLYMQLDQSGNNTLQKFQEFTGWQLTAEQQKAYTLLHDIKWLGWWNTSDTTNAAIVQGAKIAGMIVAGITAGILTGGAGFLAYAAAGAAMTAAECVIFNKAMWVKEAVTTTAINTAGMAVWWVLSGVKSAGIWAQAVWVGLARAGTLWKAALKVGASIDDIAARWASVAGRLPGVQRWLQWLRSMEAAGGAKALVSEGIQSGADYSAGAVMEWARQQIMEGKWAEEAFLAALTDPTSLAMMGVPVGMNISKKLWSGKSSHRPFIMGPDGSPALWTSEMKEGYQIIEKILAKHPEMDLEWIREILHSGSGDPDIDARIDALWHTYHQNRKSQYDNGNVIDIEPQTPWIVQDLSSETTTRHVEDSPSTTQTPGASQTTSTVDVHNTDSVSADPPEVEILLSQGEIWDTIHPHTEMPSKSSWWRVSNRDVISLEATDTDFAPAMNKLLSNPEYTTFAARTQNLDIGFTNKIQMGENTLFASNRFIDKKGYEYIIAVTDDGHPRLFYKSQSGGWWHSTQGVRDDGGFWKWDSSDTGRETSYEKTGNVAVSVQNSFENLSIKPMPERIVHDPIRDLTLKNITWENFKEQIRKKAVERDEGLLRNSVRDFNEEIEIRDLRPRDMKIPAFAEMRHGNKDYIKSVFQNSTLTWLNGKMEKVGQTNMTHTLLGECNVDLMQWKINGDDVIFEIAYQKNNPDLPWVHNIRSADSRISSFGIESKQFLWGLVYTKPLEYASQLPFTDWSERQMASYGNKGQYTDIRSLIQELPIIKTYKNAIRIPQPA